MFQKFEKNKAGRDFVVGDIHGCFDKLEAALKEVGFNEETDRLFSVGDLVDRGPCSELAAMYLSRPWFHAVRGNHEQMALEWEPGGRMDPHIYAHNGGQWFMDLLPWQQENYQRSFAQMPIAIEVETDAGRIGIVHADCPCSTWQQFIDDLNAGDEISITMALWDRTRIKTHHEEIIPDIDVVIVGHTPLKEIAALGNVLYIDTGAVFGRKLTVLPLDSLTVIKESE